MSVSFSPNGQILAIASQDSSIRLWSVDHSTLKTLQDIAVGWGSCLQPDGQILASGEYHTIRLWEIGQAFAAKPCKGIQLGHLTQLSPNGQSAQW